MKCAGILTFQNANNYGAVFQAYALQETLQKLGAEVRVINYDSSAMGLKNVQKSCFRDFTEKYLHLTEEYCLGSEIDVDGYNIIITGSDQVWNPKITHNDTTYFLDFIKQGISKASYAASIGLNINLLQEHKKIFADNLSDFTGISLREKSHVSFVQGIVSNPVVASIDPTLLLSEQEYMNKLNLKNDEKKYIFMYSNNMDSKLLDFTNMLAVYLNCTIVSVSNFKNYFLVNNGKVLCDVPPVQWLQYLKNAYAVVTDSYHGMMMSIVFGRPFYVYTPNRENVLRIKDALEIFGLENRSMKYIKSMKDVKLDIDFGYVEQILNKEREASVQYLRKILNNA